MNADSSPLPFPPQLYLGFSGKRSLGDEAAVRAALTTRLKAIGDALPGIEIVAISSAAEGADQLFLEVARDFGWAWRIVLPVAPAIFEQDFEKNIPVLERFHRLCENAAALDVIPPPSSRRDGFTLCAEAIGRQSDLLVVLWDGVAGKQGGTTEAIHLFRQLGRPCVVLSSADGAAISNDLADPNAFSDLIKIVRERHDHGIVARLREIGEAVSPFPILPSGVTLPPHYATPIVTTALFDRLRSIAFALGNQHRRANALVLLLPASASLFGVFGLVFETKLGHGAHLVLNVLEFALVSAGVGLTIWLKRTHLHSHWVETRYLTEIVRSLVATARCPVRADYVTATAWEVYAKLRMPLTTFFGRHRVPGAVDKPLEFAERYLARRIRYQLDHHEKKRVEAHRDHRRVHGAFIACTAIILLGGGTAFALALKGPLPTGWMAQLLLQFAPVYLPVVSAALLVLPNLNDLNRRRSTYLAVVEKLTALAQETETLIADLKKTTPPAVKGVPVWSDPAFSDAYARNRLHALVHETERVLLTEVIEFQSFCKHAEVG